MLKGTRKRLLMCIVLGATLSGSAIAQAQGTANVRVVTDPEFPEVSVNFTGSPSGEVTLGNNGRGSLSANVSAGQHLSTLANMDDDLVVAGYRLTEIQCDDGSSQNPSSGSATNGIARFGIEEGESVACTFVLKRQSSCTCPKEGRWSVNNHLGSMTCTGAMNMTQPLKPSGGSGRITVNSDCSQVHASGMSDDEADIDMQVQSDCSWVGVVGGSQDGIPMNITFTWNVQDEETITGDLYSEVSQQGVTCRMTRTYDLNFDG